MHIVEVVRGSFWVLKKAKNQTSNGTRLLDEMKKMHQFECTRSGFSSYQGLYSTFHIEWLYPHILHIENVHCEGKGRRQKRRANVQ